MFAGMLAGGNPPDDWPALLVAMSGDLGRTLAKAGTATPIPGDELPEGWPDSHG